MRVQLYWALSALKISVPDHYLRKQSGELGWIQYALRGPALWATALAIKLGKPERAGVKKGWIKSQRNYFNRKAPVFAQASRRGRLWRNAYLGLGLALSVALFLTEICWPEIKFEHPIPRFSTSFLHVTKAGLLVCATTATAIAAFFSISRELRAYEAHRQSYSVMGRLFDRALDEAKAVDGMTGEAVQTRSFQRLARELGREALAENAEWLQDHRRRTIES